MKILMLVYPNEIYDAVLKITDRIADATSAEITALYVREAISRKFYSPFSIQLNFIDRTQEKNLFGKISKILHGHRVIKKSRGGELVSQVLEEVERGKYDLLIFGDINQKTTKKIAEYVHIPALIIKKHNNLKSFLVCTDGSKYSEKAVVFTGKLAKVLNAKIDLLSVARNDSEIEIRKKALEEGSKILNEISISYNTKIVTGNVRRKIIENSNNYDVVALAPRGLSKIKRVLVGHVSLYILENVKTNILLVK